MASPARSASSAACRARALANTSLTSCRRARRTSDQMRGVPTDANTRPPSTRPAAPIGTQKRPRTPRRRSGARSAGGRSSTFSTSTASSSSSRRTTPPRSRRGSIRAHHGHAWRDPARGEQRLVVGAALDQPRAVDLQEDRQSAKPDGGGVLDAAAGGEHERRRHAREHLLERETLAELRLGAPALFDERRETEDRDRNDRESKLQRQHAVGGRQALERTAAVQAAPVRDERDLHEHEAGAGRAEPDASPEQDRQQESQRRAERAWDGDRGPR